MRSWLVLTGMGPSTGVSLRYSRGETPLRMTILLFVRVKGLQDGAMDFQVNEKTYILRLADDERRWQFFVSTPGGARRIPVYVDAPKSVGLVVLDEDEPQRMPN